MRGFQVGRRRWRSVVALSCAVGGVTPIANAATTNFWTNADGGTWNVASNWNNGAGPVPTGADVAQFDLASAYAVTFTAPTTSTGTYNQTAGDVTWNGNAGSPRLALSPSVNLLGGTLALSAATTWVDVSTTNTSVDAGTSLAIAAGSDWTATTAFLVGQGGSGAATVTIDGSGSRLVATNAAGGLSIGDATRSGNVTFSNTATASLSALTLSRGSFSLLSGADAFINNTVTVGGTTAGDPAAINISGSGSGFSQSGATNMTVGSASGNAASINVSGGAGFSTGTGTLTVAPTGTIEWGSATLNFNGNVHVDGGTLRRPSLGPTLFLASGKSILIDNGGKLELTGDGTLSSVTVSGTNSKVTATGLLSVLGGTGTVTSGALASAATVNISNGGTLIVDGSGSSLSMTTLNIGGSFTTGKLVLSNNATATISGNVSPISNSIDAIAVQSGADLTASGNVTIPIGVGAYVTGSGSTFTQTGSGTMSVTAGMTAAAKFTSSFGGVISTGTGLLTVNAATAGFTGTGQFIANGNVLLQNGGLLSLTGWAAGKTMTMESTADVTFGDVTLVNNTINSNGNECSIISSGNVTMSGGSSLTVLGAHSSASLTRLHLGTDGTSASVTYTPSEGASLTTSMSDSNWGASGGSATVTIGGSGQASLAGFNLASTGTGTSGVIQINGRIFSTTRFTMQNATTSGGSAVINVTGAGAQLNTTMGTLESIVGGAAGTGVAAINLTSGGSMNIVASQFTIKPTGTLNITNSSAHTGRLNLAGGKINFNSGTLSTSSFVSITNGGQLDLQANGMVVRSGSAGTWNGSNYSGISGLVKSGRNGGDWNGTGIITSEVDAQAGGVKTIGVVANSSLNKTSFAGLSVATADALVLYTYAGDADLSGFIDGDDFFRIDTGFNASGSGWFNGDFNYSGNVDADDYWLIDRSYAAGGSLAPSSGVTGVPEPGGIVFGSLALVMARGRRRSRR